MGLRGRRVTGPRTGLPTFRGGCDAERQLLGAGRDDESSLRVPLRGRRWGRPLLPAAVARVAPREDEAPSAGAQSDDRPVRASNGAVLLDDFDGPFHAHGSARLLHDASCSCPRCGPRFITAALHGSPPVPLSDRHHGTLLAEPLAPRHELSDFGRPGRVTRPLPLDPRTHETEFRRPATSHRQPGTSRGGLVHPPTPPWLPFAQRRTLGKNSHGRRGTTGRARRLHLWRGVHDG